jgi:hypothetical protein
MTCRGGDGEIMLFLRNIKRGRLRH